MTDAKHDRGDGSTRLPWHRVFLVTYELHQSGDDTVAGDSHTMPPSPELGHFGLFFLQKSQELVDGCALFLERLIGLQAGRKMRETERGTAQCFIKGATTNRSRRIFYKNLPSAPYWAPRFQSIAWISPAGQRAGNLCRPMPSLITISKI